MGDFLKEVAIGIGTALVKAGVDKLGEFLTADEIHETVAGLLPPESASRKAQRAIEAGL